MKTYLKITIFVLMLAVSGISIQARTKEQNKNKKQEGSQVLRASLGTFDLQRNKVSSIDLYTTNYGLIGHNAAANIGGGVWPRGSANQYIFGGGVWFAAKKIVRGDTALLCEISYSPGSGTSWFAPGMIEDGDSYLDEFNKKYRVYFSTDFNKGDGVPSNLADGPNWPIWDNSPNPFDTIGQDRYVGNYVFDINQRNNTTNAKGPAFISQEDIFAVFKDTDLSRYEGGVETRRSQGYPLRLQYEQMIYSWGFGDYKDFMFIKYIVINKSNDTLYDCWAAPAYDMDIATTTNSSAGADNDHTRYVNEVDTLNLAIQWSGTNRGEAGKGFGYIGFDFLESPAVDANRNIRHDQKAYISKEQIGLKTFKSWPITVDPTENAERYNFVSSMDKDGDIGGAGDKRFLMSTGPFNLRPNDTARVVVGLMFAATAAGQDADGTFKDLINLIRIDTFAQAVYDNNYKTPKAPDEAFVYYKPLNNAVLISWDSTSEMSYDPLEEGMDFLGYKLYRARRDDLDTFNVDQQNNAKKGPFGWKQIAEWKMDLPFLKSLVSNGFAPGAPFFDSVRIVQQLNTSTFIVRRFANHTTFTNPLGTNQWGKYFGGLSRQERSDLFTGKIIVDTLQITVDRPTWGNFSVISPWLISTLPSGEMIDLPWYPGPLVSNGQFKLADSIKYANLTRRLNELLNTGKAAMVFPNFEPDTNVRKKIRNEVIIPYMNSITNNSTFIDIGDDNRDGVVNEDADPALTEKLINNVQYFYRLTAWDEGDYKIASPIKINTGIKDRNQISAYPGAAPAGNNNGIVQIVSADSNLLGGLYNFQFKVLDQQRFSQLFANSDNEGHELELEFQPMWGSAFYPTPTAESPNPAVWGLYQREITLRDKTTGKTLFKGNTYLEPVLGKALVGFSAPELFTENAATYIGSDTLQIDTINGEQNSFGVPTDKGRILRIGRFTTEKTGDDGGTYSSLIDNEAKQTLGFSFDYGIQQQGGKLRIDTAYVSTNTGGASTPVTYNSDIGDQISLTERVDTVFDETGAGRIVFGSFNNGPAHYEIEFTPGGTETFTVPVGNTGVTKDFTVNYLTMKVFNKISYKRLNEKGDSVTVGYPNEVPLVTQAVVAPEFPLRTEVPIGAYDLSAFGWVNSRTLVTAAARAKQAAGFVGQQGRYYLSSIQEDPSAPGKFDTLDFVHIFQASGAELGLDYANRGRRDRGTLLWDVKSGYTFGNDFKVGDKLQFNLTGGATGLPMPGAKISAKIISSVPKIDEYTDNMLDQVRVVPNPYYVTTQIQRSPYDAKIFFTKLPKQCTISIYTVSGELIKKLEHNEFTSSDPAIYALEVWDLIASSKQRVASQTLIAKIETPNGAQTIQKFSVVVGSSRIVPE
ncbi:MAG: hypothetical protein HYZ54_04460 [Ignavibacteriae bacterium]|nr:hypothetical protein [Ignavibacteriota bacterium]